MNSRRLIMNKGLVAVIHHRQSHYIDDQLKADSVFPRKLYQQNLRRRTMTLCNSVKQGWRKVSVADARFTSKATY
jgi:hypothetical protein